MSVKCIVAGELQENTFIYCDEKSKESVIIDPGDDYEQITNYIEKNKIKLTAILLTHAHYDHITSAGKLRDKYSLPIIISNEDASILSSAYLNLSEFFQAPITLVPDKTFSDGDLFKFGDKVLQVIATPGHTPGGVCYYSENDKLLFSGDTLFNHSIGRTDFEYGNFDQIIMSITKRLMSLPDDTVVYPGHGTNTTIGKERMCFS